MPEAKENLKTTPHVCVLAIGDELVDGTRADLHTQWLAGALRELGWTISGTTLVRDTVPAIQRGLAALAQLWPSDSDQTPRIFITTGGLGPTSDDLTTETLARTYGWKLVLDEVNLNRIREYFAKRGFAFGKGQEKQCLLPEGATVFENQNGTAPGFMMAAGKNKWAIVLPGPPNELQPMMQSQVIPHLKKNFAPDVLTTKIVQVFETPESQIASEIDVEDREIQKLGDASEPIRLAYREKFPRVYVKMEWKGKELQKKGQDLFQRIVGKLQKFPGLQSDVEDLEDLIIPTASHAGVTIAVAESCTGGAISERLTRVSGSSKVIQFNVVTYSNDAKNKFLNVPAADIEKHGAVSEVVAGAMARGVAQQSAATLGLSVTGIAGPTGGTPEKPVGLVFIGTYDKRTEKTAVYRFQFRGNRQRVRFCATEMALWKLWGILNQS